MTTANSVEEYGRRIARESYPFIRKQDPIAVRVEGDLLLATGTTRTMTRMTTA